MYECTMSEQSGSEWPGRGGGGGECAQVHYEQTVREGVARPRLHELIIQILRTGPHNRELFSSAASHLVVEPTEIVFAYHLKDACAELS